MIVFLTVTAPEMCTVFANFVTEKRILKVDSFTAFSFALFYLAVLLFLVCYNKG